MVRHRVYLDTLVFGGCLDAGFARESLRFFALVRAGRIDVLISRIVAEELLGAPERVRDLLRELPRDRILSIELKPAVLDLRDAYLAEGIVGPESVDDPTHVAAASVARADAITSWNFKHIVRFDKIRRYNEVNGRLGFPPLTIVSPQMVRFDDEEQA